MIKNSNRVAGLISFFCVVLLDQVTKSWVVHSPLPQNFLPNIDIVLVFNEGISFGLLNGGKPWQFVLIGMMIFLVGLLLIRQCWKAETAFQSICFGAIIGGAVGNVIDRLIYGAVVDFIDFHLEKLTIPFIKTFEDWHWPAFNVADAAIVSSIFLLLISCSFHKQKKRSK
jgi:signal peptidase II